MAPVRLQSVGGIAMSVGSRLTLTLKAEGIGEAATSFSPSVNRVSDPPKPSSAVGA